MLKQAGWSGSMPIVRSWLLGVKQIKRVDQDFWLPVKFLPKDVKRTRLQVLPIRSMRSDDMQALDDQFTYVPKKLVEDSYKLLAPQSVDSVIIGGEVTAMTARWTTILRTINLLEGFLSIPASVRAVYSPAVPGEERLYKLLDAVWHEDGEHFWLWLDRQKHRFYGPGLLSKIEWNAPGDVLRIEWVPDVLTIFFTTYNEQIQQEEARLIDQESLKGLRGGLGESYRDSVQRILSMAPEGLTLQEIMQTLSVRLGHTVHHGTVFAMLNRGGFVRRDQRLFAAPDDAMARLSLRTALMTILLPEREDLDKHQPPPSLGEQIHQQTQAIMRRLE